MEARATTVEELSAYAEELRQKLAPSIPTQKVVKLRLSKHVGGRCLARENLIEISEYNLADFEEAKATIRHEMAHIIGYHWHIPRWGYHGRPFKDLMKRLFPDTWERDMYWNVTPNIRVAMQTLGVRKYTRPKLRVFKCPDCGRVRVETRRIPNYFRRGFFRVCVCGCGKLVEVGGKGEVFSSVYTKS